MSKAALRYPKMSSLQQNKSGWGVWVCKFVVKELRIRKPCWSTAHHLIYQQMLTASASADLWTLLSNPWVPETFSSFKKCWDAQHSWCSARNQIRTMGKVLVLQKKISRGGVFQVTKYFPFILPYLGATQQQKSPPFSNVNIWTHGSSKTSLLLALTATSESVC